MFLSTFLGMYADTLIQMEDYNGVYRIPCTVNGAKMKFIFDTGASNVCLSMTMAEYLLDNDFIATDDIIGNGQSSVADGRIVDHITVNIKDIEISGHHLYNVKAIVIDGQNAPLLMGQSAIQKLGEISLNGNLLTIKDNINSSEDYIETLLQNAKKAMDDKRYTQAIKYYSEANQLGALSDYGKFRYGQAHYFNEDYTNALTVFESFDDYSYFENNKIDIYYFIARSCQMTDRLKDAINFYELSSKRTTDDIEDWYNNLASQGDCYLDLGMHKLASEKYYYALGFFAKSKGVEFDYIWNDCRNKLKKKQTSFRNEFADYCAYYYLFCSERAGEISTESFLATATALARANNRFAIKMCNDARIDPYSSAWY